MSHTNDYKTLIEESRALFKQDHFSEAISVLQQAERIDPLGTEFEQIQHAMRMRDYHRASLISQNMLEMDPHHPRAVFTLSQLYALQGKHEARSELLESAIKHAPANLFLRQHLIVALEDCGDFSGAIEAARNLVKIKASFENLLGLMRTLLRHGFNEEVLELTDPAYVQCEEDAEKQSEVDLLRGQALKILGNRKYAITAFRDCLENKPSSGAPWWALADMKNYHFSDEDIQAMQGLALRSDLASDHRVQSCFALAKAYELRGDLADAMGCYDQANTLRGTGGFQARRFSSAINKLKECWTADTISPQAGSVSHSVIPIFILGMPRSGSTLVEQIMASHSEIEGTIEMMTLPSVKRHAHILCQSQFGQSYLEAIGRLSVEDLANLGRRYLERSAIYRKEDKLYVIDKLPNNFEHIGLIHKILPQAKVIDVRRHPMDCGYSLYKQYFRRGADYSYDLASIGAYYNGYLDLMDHWNQLLPDKVMCVRYETLIEKTEAVTRHILDFIGVKFENSCLEFYKNTRAVRTASSEQVRQPIYTKSIGAWQPLAKRLTSLSDSLGKETLERFESPLISEPS